MSAADAHQTIQTLYTDHHRWLKGWLRRRLGCPEQAADLAHDTFIRALVSPHVGAIDEPRAFLTTLVKRVLYSFWRRRELEQAYLDALAALPEGFAPSAEELILLREAVEAIDAQLDGLPLKVKQAFLLNRLDGMTHVAIASEMGISLATVERHVRRAWLHCLAYERSAR